MAYADQVAALATVLQTHHGDLQPASPPKWSVPHRVLDAVLVPDTDPARLGSLRYHTQVIAPIEAFRRVHPGVRTLADLRLLIGSYPTPADFAREALGAVGRCGAVTLALVDHLLAKLEMWADVLTGTTEAERVADVLSEAYTSTLDAYDVEGRPLSEDGYAYLRMQLGAPVVVPEPPVVAFVQEMLGDGGGVVADPFGHAVRSAALPPLAVLWGLRKDWAQGRMWTVGTHRRASWVPFLDALLDAFDSPSDQIGDRVGRLHHDAPHAPPGGEAALQGDHLVALNTLRRGPDAPGYGTVADRVLIALHSVALGNPMDTEAEFGLVHKAAADLIRALEAGGEPAAPDVQRCLRSLFERAGARALPWHRRPL